MAITEQDKPRFTAAQFFALMSEEPESAELHDGEVIMLAGASARHQLIAGGLYAEIYQYIKANKGKCIPFQPPFDVVLDEKTVYQPDVMVFCDPSKIGEKRAYGAPDLVIEVLSESTRKADLVDKYAKYANSGVREYWIVDPFEERTIVYLFGDPMHVSFYGFDQPIPVGIWEGGLELTVAELLG